MLGMIMCPTIKKTFETGNENYKEVIWYMVSKFSIFQPYLHAVDFQTFTFFKKNIFCFYKILNILRK